MSLTPTDIDGIQTCVLDDYEKGKLTNIATTLQRFEFWNRAMNENKVSKQGGKQITFAAITAGNGSFGASGYYDQDTVNVQDNIATGSIPWRFYKHSYAYDVQEQMILSSETELWNFIEARLTASLISAAEGFEDLFWTAASSDTNTAQIWSIPTWCVRSSGPGFVGGNPSGFSSGIGLNSTTYSNWKNYSDQYSNITKDDLVAGLRRALTFCRFESPMGSQNLPDPEPQRVLYTNYDVISGLETLAEQQNDSLGSDVASMDGKVLIRGLPMRWVPKLDADSTDPIYGWDWSTSKMAVLEGNFKRRTGPKEVGNQRNVRTVHWDYQFNLYSMDRRRNFVMYK